MTSRERFRLTMSYGRPDRPPLFEEGLRDDVMERWRAQGLASEDELRAMVTFDRRERITLDTSPKPALTAPMPCDADMSELRRRFNASAPGRLPEEWGQCIEQWRTRDTVLELFVHSGFFLTQGADIWDRVHRILLMSHDAPDRVLGVMEAVGACATELVRRVLADVEVDMAIFSEPISGPDRPLLGPRMYERLVLSTYRPIVAELHRGGCAAIVFQTYANTRALLPSVVEAGFNCLWAVESGEGAMDYAEIRREFGRDLRLIGGIDLDLLRTDPPTIRQAMRRIVPPLLADGGYVPLADGRVRSDVHLANYLCYREELMRLTAA
ncbi:MAG: hypothetical protein GX446_05565 [Chthonomonadales bacterium]|nr:hypothetical protein [Chthonomonadales bacterium]